MGAQAQGFHRLQTGISNFCTAEQRRAQWQLILGWLHRVIVMVGSTLHRLVSALSACLAAAISMRDQANVTVAWWSGSLLLECCRRKSSQDMSLLKIQQVSCRLQMK